ncbi:hypothetical protein RND81_09G011100 [Saponaria officinalis]|uniref:Uncharacterized protein n=1 Tax=Saponaria officinalis TaxID=3572 RepID=A0AAW1IH31_SAPOF
MIVGRVLYVTPLVFISENQEAQFFHRLLPSSSSHSIQIITITTDLNRHLRRSLTAIPACSVIVVALLLRFLSRCSAPSFSLTATIPRRLAFRRCHLRQPSFAFLC